MPTKTQSPLEPGRKRRNLIEFPDCQKWSSSAGLMTNSYLYQSLHWPKCHVSALDLQAPVFYDPCGLHCNGIYAFFKLLKRGI